MLKSHRDDDLFELKKRISEVCMKSSYRIALA